MAPVPLPPPSRTTGAYRRRLYNPGGTLFAEGTDGAVGSNTIRRGVDGNSLPAKGYWGY